MISEAEMEFITRNLDTFWCPKCGGDIDVTRAQFRCLVCHQVFPVVDEIPSLYWPNEWEHSKADVTDTMRLFYEKAPFPDYDDTDDAATLVEKARRGLFVKLLDDQIPFGARILECGCGTGQLTNFLSIASRTVIGTDICHHSLSLATRFKAQNALDGAHFYEMNLFRPCFKPQSFDLVIANGVLHHTSDPYLAFKSIAKLVRPRGYILIGLYHKYGRAATDLRRLLFKLTHDRLKFLDRRAVDPRISAAKRRAWFMDQYKNPHESKHTVGEVLTWLDATGLQFIHSIPKTVPFVRLSETEDLFKPERSGNRLERLLVNLRLIVTGHREGGFFVVIARRAEEDAPSEV